MIAQNVGFGYERTCTIIGRINTEETSSDTIGTQLKSVSQRSDRFQSSFCYVDAGESIVCEFCELLTIIDHRIDTNNWNADDEHHDDNFDNGKTSFSHEGEISEWLHRKWEN